VEIEIENKGNPETLACPNRLITPGGLAEESEVDFERSSIDV
jgi:hypothetical protein